MAWLFWSFGWNEVLFVEVFFIKINVKNVTFFSVGKKKLPPPKRGKKKKEREKNFLFSPYIVWKWNVWKRK